MFNVGIRHLFNVGIHSKRPSFEELTPPCFGLRIGDIRRVDVRRLPPGIFDFTINEITTEKLAIDKICGLGDTYSRRGGLENHRACGLFYEDERTFASGTRAISN